MTSGSRSGQLSVILVRHNVRRKIYPAKPLSYPLLISYLYSINLRSNFTHATLDLYFLDIIVITSNNCHLATFSFLNRIICFFLSILFFSSFLSNSVPTNRTPTSLHLNLIHCGTYRNLYQSIHKSSEYG